MSTLKADTIVAADGTSPVTLTKQSAAKAWASFDTDAVINESFNGSSITDDAVGKFKLTATNAMNTSTFAQTAGSGNTKHFSGWESVRTTTVTGILGFNNSHAFADENDMNIVIHGDLA
jgi:hypothetical protein